MKTVIEMAREIWSAGDVYIGPSEKTLELFVELVRADEREACAKLVEPNEEHRRDAIFGYLGGTEGVELLDQIATAIRARGSNT